MATSTDWPSLTVCRGSRRSSRPGASLSLGATSASESSRGQLAGHEFRCAEDVVVLESGRPVGLVSIARLLAADSNAGIVDVINSARRMSLRIRVSGFAGVCCHDDALTNTPPIPSRSECDLLISGGRVLALDAASSVLDDTAIAVRDGAIVAVGARAEIEASFTAERLIDATCQVVAPGFIDAHVHLGAFLGAGRPYQPSAGP